MILSDEELNKVTGGLTNNQIVEIINEIYGEIPEEIREKIIETLNKYGKKAAKALVERLVLNNYPWAKSIIILFE